MLRNLRTSTKLILLCSAFVVAIAATTYSLVAEKRIAIDFARKELAGNRYLAAVRDVYAGLLSGAAAPKLSPDHVLATLASARENSTDQLAVTEFEEALAGALRLLQWSQPEDSNADALLLDALARARQLALRVGEDSNLVLDPDLDSYYLQDIVVTKLPAFFGHLGEAEMLFRGAAAAEPRSERRMRFLVLDGLLRGSVDGMRDNLGAAYRGNSGGGLRRAVDVDFAVMIRSANSYLSAVNANIVAGAETEIDVAALDRLHANAVANALAAWRVGAGELDRLLRQRIDGLLDRLYGSLALTGVLAALSILIAVMTHRNIVRPLERLEHVASTVRQTRNYNLRIDDRSRDEIGRLVAAFNDMLAELAAARKREAAEQQELARVGRLHMMGEMTASIAHEINQPLAAIVTNSNAGLRWLNNPTPNLDEARATLQRIADDGHRASKVIGSVRAMFKKEDQERTPLDLNDLVRDMLALVQVQLQNQSVFVQTELADNLPRVVADRVQLQQVVLNLMTNAADAMACVSDRARLMRVRSAMHYSYGLLLTVEDSGTGIDPSNLDRLFDPFFTTKSDGMGLGLSICRSIVESHGGRMWVTSGNPHGSVFHVLLPAAESGERAQ
jgi:signal transduction histidine kinase